MEEGATENEKLTNQEEGITNNEAKEQQENTESEKAPEENTEGNSSETYASYDEEFIDSGGEDYNYPEKMPEQPSEHSSEVPET